MSRNRKRERRFVVRGSSIHGRGVFALREIRKGERIIEYTGERISHAEADRRYAAEHEADDPHTFLFTVNDRIVIDATRGGNSSRWINHSCAPNCETDDMDERIYIRALQDIYPGEELAYDYQLYLDEPHTPAAKRDNPCFCGEKNCRKTLLRAKSG
jgi:SET domain-containing protein